MLLQSVQIHYYHIVKQCDSYQWDRRLEESFDIDTYSLSNQGMIHRLVLGGLYEYLTHNLLLHLEILNPNQALKKTVSRNCVERFWCISIPRTNRSGTLV